MHWLTKPGNPFFARVAVNRLWAQLLGRGIVHPVDDFRSSNPPTNTELLDALAADFEAHRFDRKHIIRTICLSHTYQRSCTTNTFNADDNVLFSHAQPRRLTGEQLRDAIGYASRSLLPAEKLAEETALLEQQLRERRDTLQQDQPQWEKKVRDQLQKTPLWGEAWHKAGPFFSLPPHQFQLAHSDAFLPEKRLDLAAPIDARPLDLQGEPVDFGKRPAPALQRWQPQLDWLDAQEHVLESPGNAALYLYRRLHVRDEGKATLEFASEDSQRVWLDGKPVHEFQGKRPFNNGRVKLILEVTAGDHDLLIKLSHQAKQLKFRATLTQWDDNRLPTIDAPADVITHLGTSTEPLPDALRQRVLAYRDSSDDQQRNRRRTIEQRRFRMEYHTQRPFPERSQFTEAFGQPKRETACACERSSDPTIDQALTLLNGGQTHQAAISGAGQYGKFADDQLLIEELCLSAYSRPPTTRERETMSTFLKNATDRNARVHDLLWAVMNTQEFLFQH